MVVEDSHYYKNHKITIADYHYKYFPRFDLQTKELISFKNKDSYFLTDFNNKNNLRQYLESISKENGFKYLKSWLIRRKEAKNLIYNLSEFECKSLCFPSIKYINKVYGNKSYEKLCSEAELQIRFYYDQKLNIQENKELNFIVDTRENSILDVPNKQIKKLNYGDYCIEGNDNIFIERKSLNDFCGTVSAGFDRFCRELDRCKADNNYLIILIEEKFNNINSLSYLPHTKKIKASPDFIFHRARQILTNYPLTCQIVCVDGRLEAINFMKIIYSLTNNLQSLDYQYLVDTKQINQVKVV